MTSRFFLPPGDLLSRLFILIIAGLFFALFQASNLAPALSGQTLNFLFLQRGTKTPYSEIVIIGIDEDSLEQLGSWPFPRKLHADLLSHLHKARAIGFDVLFSEPSSQDKNLSHAFAEAPPVILGVAHDFRGRILDPAESLHNYVGKGLIETCLDKQGVVRRIDPSFLEKSADPALLARVLANFAIPPPQTTPASKNILVNFYGPEGTFLYLSYADVLTGIYPDDFFADRFVLIGAAALGLGDSHVTPFSLEYPMPGVEIQATILSNILKENLLTEVTWFPWAGLAIVGFLCIFVWPVKNEQWNISINTFIALLFAGTSLWFFRSSLFLDPSQPVVFLFIVYLVHLLYERIRTANAIFAEMSRIDRRIQTRMQIMYNHIPAYFIPPPTPSSHSDPRLNLNHLQAGINALSLQHHFIERLLREDLPPLILWENDSGKVILANSMFKKLWQSIPHESTALPVLDAFCDLLPTPSSLYDPRTVEKRKVQISDRQKIVADVSFKVAGRKKFFHIQMHQVVAQEAGFDGTLSILTDITKIKELEILKDEILSIVSHELKLPLTVMLGYGEILSERLSGTDKQQIDKILSQTVRMKKLIEHFLDIARMEHGRQEIRKLPFNPLHLVEEAIQAVSAVADKKFISLAKEVPYKATVLVGDFSLLTQALINLLDNAVKFSPEKTKITLRLTEEEKQLVFCVIDQGPGIPADMQQDIFEKFNRGKNEPTQEGFGLGLSFVREVIQQNGGRLYLDPQIGQGASFCFSLPKYDVSDNHS